MKNFDKEFNRTSKMIKVRFYFIMILIVITMMTIVAVGEKVVKVVKTVNEEGLKNVIERVWEGEE